MTIVTVNAGTWEEVVTTTVDTIFKNVDGRPIYVTTEATAELALDDGFCLQPGESITIGSGLDVEANAIDVEGKLFYMPLGVVTP
jgi:hypothetical protein